MSLADGRDLRERLATEVRQICRFLLKPGDGQAFLRIAKQVESITDAIEIVQRPAFATGLNSSSVVKDPFDVLEFSTLSSQRSPVTGRYNPVAPPATIRVDTSVDGLPRVVGDVKFDVVHECVSGFVHGGMIAQLFDGVLGAANVAADSPGMTGTMTVRFHRPTPSCQDLKIVAVCQRRDGRKIFSWAGLFRGEEIMAEADGLFIDVSSIGFRGIAQRNASDGER